MTKNKSIKKQKIKKPKYILRSCLLRIFGTIFVLIAVTLGGGYFVLDRYLQANCDMSLPDAYSVLNSALSSSGKKIVTNPYKTEDLSGFYNSVTNQMFIDEDKYTLNADKIQEIIDSTSSSSVEQSYLFKAFNGKIISRNSKSGVYAEENVDPVPPVDESEEEVPIDPMLAIVADIFKRDNFELDRLSQYSSENHDDFMLKLSDRNIGAFLNDVLKIFLPQSTLKALIPVSVDSEIKVAVEQVILSKESRTVESGGVSASQDVSMIKLTLSISIDPILESLMETSLSSFGFLEPFVKAVLPETLFVTAEMGLNYNVGANIFVNNMSQSEMGQLYKLVSGITKASGTELNLQSLINEQVNSIIFPIINDVASYLDFSKIDSSAERGGIMTIDAFDAVIKLAKINEGKAESDQLHSDEIITTMKGILTSDTDRIITKPYEDLYKQIAGDPDFVFDGELDDKDLNFKYIKDGATVDKDKYKLVDYKQEFMTQLEDKYLLDFSNGTADTSDDITFGKLMSMFGIGDKTTPDSEKKDLIDLFDPSKLGGILDKDDITVRITDRMMAAIVDSQLTSLIGGDSGIPLTDLKLKQLVLDKINTGDAEAGTLKTHNTMLLTLSVPNTSLIGSAVSGVAAELISNLLPPMIYFTIKVDITLLEEGKFAETDYLPTELCFNSLTNEETNQLFETIRKVAGDALKKQDLIEQIEKPMRDIMPKMTEIISVSLGESSVILPDIFQFMADKVINVNADTDADKVSSAELKELLKGLDQANEAGYEDTFKGSAIISDDMKMFYGSLNSNYYINDKITDLDDVGELLNSFDSTKFNLDGKTEGNLGLRYDTRNASDLRPKITEAELARYIQDMVIGNNELKDFQILGVDIHVDSVTKVRTISIFIKIDVDSIFPEGSQGAKLKFFDSIFIKVTCKLDEIISDVNGDYVKTSFEINNMSQAQYDTLLKMIKTLGESSFDFEAQTREIGRQIYDNLIVGLENKIKGGLTYQSDGIQLPSFYGFLSEALEIKETDGSQVDENLLKSTIQSLYEKQDGIDNIDNYTKANVTKINKAENTDAFLAELSSKYYLNDGIAFDDIMNGKLTFNSASINLNGTDASGNGIGLLNDTRSTNQLAPRLTQEEFAYILASKINISGMEVLGLEIAINDANQTVLVLYIKLNANELFPLDSEGAKLLGIDNIYIKATTTIGSSASTTTTTLVINSMSVEKLALLERIMASTGDTTFSFEDKAKDISEQIFDNLVTKLSDKVEGGLTYEEGKVIFPTFYAFMASTLNVERIADETSPNYETKDKFETNVQAALQGLHKPNVIEDNDKISENTQDLFFGKFVDKEYGGFMERKGVLSSLGEIKRFSVLEDSIVLISLEVEAKTETSSANTEFAPTTMMLNVYIDMKANGTDSKVVINGLSVRQQDILFEIVKIQDVNEYLIKCKDILTGIRADFSESGFITVVNPLSPTI